MSKKIIVAAETVENLDMTAKIPTAFEIYIAKQQAKAEADALVAKYAAEAEAQAKLNEALSTANLIKDTEKLLAELKAKQALELAETPALVETVVPTIEKPRFEIVDKRNPSLLGFDPKAGTLAGQPVVILGTPIPIIGAQPHIINVKAESVEPKQYTDEELGFVDETDVPFEQLSKTKPVGAVNYDELNARENREIAERAAKAQAAKKIKIKPIEAKAATKAAPDDRKTAAEFYNNLFRSKMMGLIAKAYKAQGSWFKGTVIDHAAPELDLKFDVALAAKYNGNGEFELARGGKKKYHIILSTDTGNLELSDIPVRIKK